MLFSLAFYYIFFVFNQPKLLQNLITITQKSSVSDPYHFDNDDPRIRFRDDGSGSDLKSNKFQFFSSYFFLYKV